MACDPLEAMVRDFSIAAYANPGFNRLLVFQRTPNSSETQTDDYGFPTSGYTDIAGSYPIPCSYVCQSGREVIIGGKQISVTVYRFTIPGLYKGAADAWIPVDFSPAYRVHLLAKDSLPEQYFQITGGGVDPDPGITFPAVKLEHVV